MIIVVDIGSRKVRIGALDKQGKLVNFVKVTTPDDAGAAIDLINSTIASHFQLNDLDKIVVGISGTVVDNRLLSTGNLDPSWLELDLIKEFKEIFDVPVMIENDANLAGAYEAKMADKPLSAVYLGVGGGIGSSVLMYGKIHPFLANSAAGLMSIEFDGAIHHWEDFASAQAINQVYGKMLSEIKAKRAWSDIADRLARGLLVLVPAIQPQTVIIGGLLGLYLGRYQTELEAILVDNLPTGMKLPRLIAARNPERSVIHGGYLAATQQIYLDPFK